MQVGKGPRENSWTQGFSSETRTPVQIRMLRARSLVWCEGVSQASGSQQVSMLLSPWQGQWPLFTIPSGWN